MNLDNFLKDCGWEIYEYDDSFGILMENSTHDIDFKLFKNGTVRYEAYNEPDDSSVILSKEQEYQIIYFMRDKIKDSQLRKDNLNN